MTSQMKAYFKKILDYLFGWIEGIDASMLAAMFFTLIWFVVDWCMSTTFRPMSFPQLYLINFTASLILLAPWMLTRSRVVAVCVQFIVCMLLEANLIYCRTYYTAITPEGYLMAGNMRDFTGSIWPNLRWSDIGFAVIFVLTAIYCLASKNKISKKTNKYKVIGRYASLTCISALLSYVYVLCIGGFYKAYDTLTQDCKTFSSGVPTYTVGGHIVFKIMEEKKRQEPNPEDLKAVEDWIRIHRERYTPNECEAPRKNLVMVICESLESWPIGLTIDGKEVTPFLNSLVNDTTTFYAPKVLTQVSVGHSIDGQLIYTTGLLPTANSVYSMRYADRDYPSLNKLLKNDRNVKSILMTTDKPITWNMLAVEQAFGYDSILCYDDWKEEEMIGRSITDGSFLRQSIETLKKGELWPENTPAMLTFVTCSGHSPFILPDNMRNPDFDISDKGLPKILEDYITITHYVDSQLHQIVDYINGRSDSEDTMIVILGDHEGLGKSRNDILKSSEYARENVGEGRYTPMIAVNSPVGGRYERVIGQADVFPTILDMLGVKEDSWRGVGVSVLDATRPNIAFSILPPAMDGEPGDMPDEEIEHVQSAQSISEMMIVNDFF